MFFCYCGCFYCSLPHNLFQHVPSSFYFSNCSKQREAVAFFSLGWVLAWIDFVILCSYSDFIFICLLLYKDKIDWRMFSETFKHSLSSHSQKYSIYEIISIRISLSTSNLINWTNFLSLHFSYSPLKKTQLF